MSFFIRSLAIILLLHPTFISFVQAQSGKPIRHVSSADREYGRQVYSQLSAKYSVMYGHPRMRAAKEIVRRLTVAAQIDRLPWQVYIFRAAQLQHAAASRGNYVFIWSGLFDALRDDQELTAVLAHVIAHVIAGHSDADPSLETHKMVIEYATTAGHFASGPHAAGHILTNGLGNIAKAISRKRERMKQAYRYPLELEYEADQISMQIAADAGYDSREVLFFWMRARNDRTLDQRLTFLRMHPPYFERLDKLGKLAEQNEKKAGKMRPALFEQPATKRQGISTAVPRSFDPQTDSFDVTPR